MLLLSMFFVKAGNPDETLSVSRDGSRFIIVYKTADTGIRYQLDTRRRDFVLNYLRTILSSVRNDANPFDHIQVSSSVTPPVEYELTSIQTSESIYNEILDLFDIVFAYPIRELPPRNLTRPATPVADEDDDDEEEEDDEDDY